MHSCACVREQTDRVSVASGVSNEDTHTTDTGDGGGFRSENHPSPRVVCVESKADIWCTISCLDPSSLLTSHPPLPHNSLYLAVGRLVGWSSHGPPAADARHSRQCREPVSDCWECLSIPPPTSFSFHGPHNDIPVTWRNGRESRFFSGDGAYYW